jgi:urease accessory protein
LRVSFKRRGEATVLDEFYQSGCLKARLPRTPDGDWTTAVTLNTSGGIAGGDRLALSLSAAAGTRATVTAQAAERFYRSVPGGAPSSVGTRIAVAEAACLEWLPQETILYDRCDVVRRLEVDLAPDAWFLGVESLVFGRTAMGEAVETGSLRDLIRVRRGDELLLHDAVRLDGPISAALGRVAIGRGSRAMATLVHVGLDAEGARDRLRDALAACDDGSSLESGVSAWNGMLIARILAADGALLRRAVMAGLAVLRGTRPLPRVWQC